MKIAVYTPAINGERHLRRWYESARDADLLLIADNGSEDKTISLARSLGIKLYEVEVNPWRYDIAKNASLALVPDSFDVCIQLNLNETLSENWRPQVELAFAAGNTWPKYKERKSPSLQDFLPEFGSGFRIHPRHGFAWKYPAYELIVPLEGSDYERRPIGLEIQGYESQHNQNIDVLGLLDQALNESPQDWRLNYARAFELRKICNWDSLLIQGLFTETLTCPNVKELSMLFSWISQAFVQIGDVHRALEYSGKSTAAHPDFQSPWYQRALLANSVNDWQECLKCLSKYHSVYDGEEKYQYDFHEDWRTFVLASRASLSLGRSEAAKLFGEIAQVVAPEEQFVNQKSLNQETTHEPIILDSNRQQDKHWTEFDFPDRAIAGSEIMLRCMRKYTDYDENLINIILSRCDSSLIDESRINILWQHVDSNQQSVIAFQDVDFLEKLDAIVFVSHWQFFSFKSKFKLPEEKCFVIKNAIEPSKLLLPNEPIKKVKIVYTSTPWRGLDVLLDAFEKLDRRDCELHIFSSTGVYGRKFYESNDRDYEHLYSRARSMPNVVYRGYVPNVILRHELNQSHVFAYPNTWAETFCVSAVEAGAYGLELVVSNVGALPEILGEQAHFVPFCEDKLVLVKRFQHSLNNAINRALTNSPSVRVARAQSFNDAYSWHSRKREWNSLFQMLLSGSKSW